MSVCVHIGQVVRQNSTYDALSNVVEEWLLPTEKRSNETTRSIPPTRMAHSIQSLDAGQHGIGPPLCMVLTPEIKTNLFVTVAELPLPRF